MHFAIFSIITTLYTAAAAQASIPPLNPDDTSVVRNLWTPVWAKIGRSVPESNAKRLAAGLPPLPPKKRWDPNAPALPRRSSSPCTSGYILVETESGSQLGYASHQLNQFGEYGALVDSITDPNVLNVCKASTSDGSGLSDIRVLNGQITTLPFIGAFVGEYSTSQTLSSDSAAHVFFAQTSQTLPSATPGPPTDTPATSQTSFGIATDVREGYESNIWNPIGGTDTQQLTLSWTNPDSSSFTPSLILVSPDGMFAATGSPSLFASTYKRTVTSIQFYFVPA
ncbi:hypothetical protein DL93DRAFT_1619090 [Clavulina sp. PMI_390]|nr:hypothetical protein DL93DRAFT_1619090 [Clavulina sp. PMI_390]